MLTKTWEEIKQIAIEMNREWTNCKCKSCNGQYGYMWFEILPDPNIYHPLNPGITTEQMVEQWEKKREKKQKRHAPKSAD